MYQSTIFYVPDIDELEFYLNPDEDHGLDREGIKLLFSYAMDVVPTDNEVSSTVCTKYMYVGSSEYVSLGCELSNCKGNDIVFVFFEKYCDRNINQHIRNLNKLNKQQAKKKFLFIIIPKETSKKKVPKNIDNMIYLDYSDFLRWRHDCELMSHQIVSSKGFAMKTKMAQILKGKSASDYDSFIKIFANSIELFCKTKLIKLDLKNNKIKIIDDRMKLQFIGQWCWGMLHYFSPERERLQWDYFEDTFIDKDGKGLGKGKIKKGHENYIKGCCGYLKKELSKTIEENAMSEILKNIKKHPEKYKFLREYWDYLSNFCDNSKIPNSLKNLLLNIVYREKK